MLALLLKNAFYVVHTRVVDTFTIFELCTVLLHAVLPYFIILHTDFGEFFNRFVVFK